MRSVFVHSGGIGDFLLACPALAAWGEGKEVTLIGQRERLALGVAAGLAAETVSLDAVDFHSLFTTPSMRCRTFFEGVDEAVVWMRDEEGLIQHGLEACGVARARCFPGLPPEDWARHASAYYAESLEVRVSPAFRLALPPINERFDVLIHPGSGGARKNWPLENFIALTRRMRDQGREVRWLLGPAEEALQVPADIAVHAESDLVRAGQCLQNAAFYVGNDSGMTHLAGLLGTRTVAIFGPTDPAVWAPLGANTRVLQGNPWASVEAVLAACGEG